MRRALPSISAAAFGLGMFACSSVDAQIPTSSRTEAALAASKAPSETVKLRDANRLIGASVSTTSGKYGSIADLVVDGTGAVQYALIEREGKFHPVPFALMQFGATGDVTLSVSSASLDGITVDRNNLQSLTNREFAAQLRSAFGPNVAREVAASAGATATTGVASSRANRERVFSMAGMFGGSISAKDGNAPGTIATAAINPNGTIAYFVGSNAAGDARFAVPFSFSTLNSDFNGVSVDVTGQALMTISIPQNSLPTMADQSFAASLRNTFGSGITNDSRGIAGGIDGMTKQESDVARRNDRSNSDPVAGAGDSRRGGADAVAGAGDSRRGGADAVAMAGDSRRGGADAVARPGDRTTPGGTVNDRTTTSSATTGSTTGGLVNSAPQTGTTPQRSVNSQNGLLQFRDLLNLRIQAQDGAFGRVSDIVLDQNGNVQYLLGSYQGQFFPLPLNQAALASAGDGTLNYNVPMASLQNLSIDPRNLPSLTDSQFSQGMQQVFGASFASNAQQSTSNYPTGSNQSGENLSERQSTSTAGANPQGGAARTGVDPIPGPRATGTTQQGSSSTNSGWYWPNNPQFPNSGNLVPGSPGTGPRTPPGVAPGPNPFTKSRTGTGTANGTNNGGLMPGSPGTGPRTPPGVPPHPNPFTKGQTGAGAGAKKMQQGSGTGTGSGARLPPGSQPNPNQFNKGQGGTPPTSGNQGTSGNTGSGGASGSSAGGSGSSGGSGS